MTGPSDKFIARTRNAELAVQALSAPRAFVRLPKPEGVVEIVTYRGAGR
jgi:hypothetical protein